MDNFVRVDFDTPMAAERRRSRCRQGQMTGLTSPIMSSVGLNPQETNHTRSDESDTGSVTQLFGRKGRENNGRMYVSPTRESSHDQHQQLEVAQQMGPFSPVAASHVPRSGSAPDSQALLVQTFQSYSTASMSDEQKQHHQQQQQEIISVTQVRAMMEDLNARARRLFGRIDTVAVKAAQLGCLPPKHEPPQSPATAVVELRSELDTVGRYLASIESKAESLLSVSSASSISHVPPSAAISVPSPATPMRTRRYAHNAIPSPLPPQAIIPHATTPTAPIPCASDSPSDNNTWRISDNYEKTGILASLSTITVQRPPSPSPMSQGTSSQFFHRSHTHSHHYHHHHQQQQQPISMSGAGDDGIIATQRWWNQPRYPIHSPSTSVHRQPQPPSSECSEAGGTLDVESHAYFHPHQQQQQRSIHPDCEDEELQTLELALREKELQFMRLQLASKKAATRHQSPGRY